MFYIIFCLQKNPPEKNKEQFPPNLSCLQNNLPENNVKDLAGTCFTLFSSRLFSRYSCVVVLVYLLWFLPNLSCLQNNPPENNVEQFPPNLSCLQNNPPQNNVEDLAGTRFTLFSSKLLWDRFLLDLGNFFGTRFRYKLMYYYFYHRSDLCEIIQFLCKIE